MTELPHPILHNRKEAAEFVGEHYAPQLELLTQMVNYASNLIPRAFNSSPKQMCDLMACFGFLKQFASMLDATEVLLRAGAVHASFAPARVAFESSLYLEWLLVSDGEKKAAHYYVGDIRRERIWGLRAQKATSEGSDFLKEMGQLGADIAAGRPALNDEGIRHVADVERILALPEYAQTNTAFDAYKKRKGIAHEPEWYKVLGKRSIREIARELQRVPEYIIYYGQGSQVTHSASYKDQLKFKGKGVSAQPIRNLTDVHTAFNYAFTTAMHVFHRVLAFYRPDELLAFSLMYINEWRSAFTNIPTAIVKDAER